MTDLIFVDVVTRKLAVLVAVDDAEAMVRQLATLPVVAGIGRSEL